MIAGVHPGIFRAREASWNRGISIKASCTTHKRKIPQGKNLVFFVQDILKTAF